MQDVKVGLKRSTTIFFTIMEKVLVVMGEVDLGLRLSPLPPIIQVFLVAHWSFIVMVMTGVDISLVPSNFLCINMVDYTFPTQGFLKKLLQGVFKQKSTLNSSLLFLSNNATTPSSNHATTS